MKQSNIDYLVNILIMQLPKWSLTHFYVQRLLLNKLIQYLKLRNFVFSAVILTRSLLLFSCSLTTPTLLYAGFSPLDNSVNDFPKITQGAQLRQSSSSGLRSHALSCSLIYQQPKQEVEFSIMRSFSCFPTGSSFPRQFYCWPSSRNQRLFCYCK